MIRFHFGFYLVLFLFSLTLPLFTFAQTPSVVDPIELTLTPQSPAPSSRVDVRADSFITDLNKATISWSIDGKQIKSSIGGTTFSFTAPANGKKSILAVTVRTSEGRDIRKTLTIAPADVSLTWESTGIIPVLYKGKSLAAYQTIVKVVAMPELYQNGVRLNPENVVYTWKRGATVLGSASGYGKQTLTIEGGVIPEPVVVSVTAQSRDGQVTGSASLSIDFTDPEIVFYKEDPLYGILFNKALTGQESLTHNEVKIVAMPYFFNTPGSYRWSVNNLENPNLLDQSSIVLRNNGKGGTSLIGLEIRAARNILQSARNNFTVYFNKVEPEETPEL